MGDSGDLRVGLVGQSALSQDFRANTRERSVTVLEMKRVLLPNDAVNAGKSSRGACDTNGLIGNGKTRTEGDGVCPFLSYTNVNAISPLLLLGKNCEADQRKSRSRMKPPMERCERHFCGRKSRSSLPQARQCSCWCLSACTPYQRRPRCWKSQCRQSSCLHMRISVTKLDAESITYKWSLGCQLRPPQCMRRPRW